MRLALLCAELLFAFLTALSFRKRVRQTILDSKRRMEILKASLRSQKEALEKQETEHRLLEGELSSLIEIYELAKKISASLKFEEFFSTLLEMFQDHFPSKKGYLLLFDDPKKEDGPPRASRIYSLSSGLEEAGFAYLGAVLKRIEEKEILRSESPSFVAVSLRVKDKVIAAVTGEGLDGREEEKLALLCRQFTLALQKVRLYEKLQELSITDGLTRLFVRRYFLERFREELERSKRHHLHLSFLMADIDHFKEKNDKYGHLVGDVILREVATILKTSVREIDLVGRYGGEEFSVALPDTTLSDTLQVAERIRKAIEEKNFEAYDEVVPVTISIGASSFPEDGEELVDLIDVADSALYHAKQSGRNRISARART